MHTIIHIDTEHYGWVVGQYIERSEADENLTEIYNTILDDEPNALPCLMYSIVWLDEIVKLGNRIRYC